jgi:adenine-specific DNA methylase
MTEKRLIEVDFPLKEVSEESVKEKYIRKHIATLHPWWARRPLAASRVTTYAALVPAPHDSDKLREKLNFIAKLSKWENSLNKDIIEKARKDIREFFNGKAPKVLDCFAGGGSIPLEALRLGCETYALEYNPVAMLILKAVLEYPQKYANLKVKIRETNQKTLYGEIGTNEMPKLIYDVQKWGNWIYEEAKKEIGKFYPSDSDGSTPVGYIWARTIRCKNPSCGAEIPLMKQFWLARKKNKKVALEMITDKEKKKIDFKIVKNKEIKFDPSIGNIKRGTVLCPLCKAGQSHNYIQKQASEKKVGYKLIGVILDSPTEGKLYRIANENDLNIFESAKCYLPGKLQNLMWDYDPIPTEPMNINDPTTVAGRGYGFQKWGELFNERQKLALITFVEKVRTAYTKMIKIEGYEKEYAQAVTVYLALGISRLANRMSMFTYWYPQGEKIQPTFVRQALPMVWDFIELNPFNTSSGGWQMNIYDIINVLRYLTSLPTNSAETSYGTATRLPYPNNYFDAVITDPPYYDNANYAELSDFFYVWLKRLLSDILPELFSTPLTPKTLEIIMNPARHDGDVKKAKEFFENMIYQAFTEIYRVLKDDGIAVIVFAHKSTDAWETIINSLIRAGLTLTASWPLRTEMETRVKALGTASLISSIYMVCRKSGEKKIAYFNEIKEKIEKRVKEKLEQFWEQGISGADFFVSAIGPAVEVFGQYSRVEKLSGEEVSVKELLEYVRKVVSEFALERVLKRADLGGVDTQTRFYLLWRWTFGNAKVHFDDAIKLSRPLGVELTELWDRGGFVRKEKEFVRVLQPQERAKDQAFVKKTKFTSMVDVLHYALMLWENGEREKIKEILHETGYARNEIFWQTAQAISEILPEGDKEKQLIQGFLYGKEDYIKEYRKEKTRTLFDFMEKT